MNVLYILGAPKFLAEHITRHSFWDGGPLTMNVLYMLGAPNCAWVDGNSLSYTGESYQAELWLSLKPIGPTPKSSWGDSMTHPTLPCR